MDSIQGNGGGDVVIHKDSVYLDYNATTPIHPDVIQSITLAMSTLWRNPSSSYDGLRCSVILLSSETRERSHEVVVRENIVVASEVRDAIGKARQQVAQVIGGSPGDIIFTSTGTEANNWIIESVVSRALDYTCGNIDGNPKPHVIMSDVEHDAVAAKVNQLVVKGVCDVSVVSARNRGRVVSLDVLKHCQPSTCLISIMMANNETGVIQPIAEISRDLGGVNDKRIAEGFLPILFHTDAAQAIGKIPVDVKQLGVDLLTIVGHKFYGPRTGAVFCRGDLQTIMKPLFFGGNQERGFRPGTENTAAIVGLGKAAELAESQLAVWRNHFTEIGRYFVNNLKGDIKKFGPLNWINYLLDGQDRYALRNEIYRLRSAYARKASSLVLGTFGKSVIFNFDVLSDAVLPNTFSLHFIGDQCAGYKVLANTKLIQASTGAACHSGMLSASKVLLNSGLSQEAAVNTIRISFGRSTTHAEIDTAIKELEECLKDFKAETKSKLVANAPN